MENTLDAIQALQVIDLDAGTVFSGSPSGRMVKGYASPSPFTPAVDPTYIYHEQSRDLVVWFLEPTDPLYVYGPSGSGKTSCIKQVAAKLNFPVFEVTGHSRLEFLELVGHHAVHEGNMEFEYGPLALAMKYGGIMLLNEIDLLEPSTAAGLNGILDGQPLCIPENKGELIVPHEMFRFAATANTNGNSDDTGLYQGTMRQNLAFMDRFIVCEISYPAPDAEEQLLSRTAPGLPEGLRKKMVEYANEVRRLFMGEDGNAHNAGSIEVTLSTRTLIRWADLTFRYQPLAKQGIKPVTYALDRALGFRACKETRAMLHELAQRMFTRKGAQSGE